VSQQCSKYCVCSRTLVAASAAVAARPTYTVKEKGAK
jgi:hypothetical protein